MTFKRILFSISFTMFFLLTGCSKDEPSVENCDIQGLIDCSSAKNSVKVTLQSAEDSELKYVAFSDTEGRFEFQNVREGEYNVTATKENYYVKWITFGNSTITEGQRITVRGNSIHNMIIGMGKNLGGLSSQLEFTMLSGQPVNSVIHIPRFTEMIGFRVYNGTDQNRSWDIRNVDRCFAYTNEDSFFEYIFSSFTPVSGTLKPGETVEIIGYFNQAIFNYKPYYPNHPGTVEAFSSITYDDGVSMKEITFDIDFQ